MNDKVFLDTNLWVYLYAETPDSRYRKVRQLVDDHFNCILCSTQIVGELYYVLTRKNLLSYMKAKEVVTETIKRFPVLAITTTNVQEAIDS